MDGIFGTHYIQIEEVSRYGDIIAVGQINVNVTKKIYTGQVCIDSPVANTSITKQTASNIMINRLGSIWR